MTPQIVAQMINKIPSIVMLVVLLFIESLSLWNQVGFRPQIILMFVYFQALYQPSQLSIVMMLSFGVCRDVILGLPLGCSGFIFCITFIVFERWRHLIQGTRIFLDWLGFALTALAAQALESSILLWQMHTQTVWTSAAARWFVSVNIYPLVAWLIQWVLRQMVVRKA